MADHNNPQSRTEEILIATIDGTEYDKLPQSRLEELLLEFKEVIEAGGGGGGTTNYNLLSNKPQINGVTLSGEMTASDLSLVLAEVGKGLSTNDYSDEEKAKVANLITAIEGILTGTDLDSFGDVETALANKVDKVNGKGLSTNDFTDEYKAAIGSNTSAITAIKDGSELDSFGDVEVALLDKADTSDLGTAAAKDSTNSVTAGSTDLVESGAVKDAIDAAVASAYHHAGTKTVAQLTHDLLIAANEGNVYNITDSGTTTSDFVEGIGKQIDAGDNVGICKVGNVYMFDLLSGLEDTSNFVRKSQTSGLLKNDGTVNSTIEDTVAGHTTAIAGKQDKYDTITYAQWQAMTPEQQAAKDYYISDYPSSVLTAGNIAYDNTTSGMTANKVQGAIDELKSGLIGLTEIDVIPLTDNFYAESDRKARYVKLNVGNNGLYVITGDFKNNEALTANTAYTIAEMPDNALVDSFGAEFNNAGKITIARNSNDLVFTPSANAAAYSTFRITIMFIV